MWLQPLCCTNQGWPPRHHARGPPESKASQGLMLLTVLLDMKYDPLPPTPSAHSTVCIVVPLLKEPPWPPFHEAAVIPRKRTKRFKGYGVVNNMNSRKNEKGTSIKQKREQSIASSSTQGSTRGQQLLTQYPRARSTHTMASLQTSSRMR